MRAYIDASVLLRIVLRQPNPVREWPLIQNPISSRLIRVEGLRTIDRARVLQELTDEALSQARYRLFEQLQGFELVPLDDPILERAETPFPTTLGTLDALHLSTAILSRREVDFEWFVTHDGDLARAARTEGFEVYGD